MKLFWPYSSSLYYNKQLLCNKGWMKILFDLYQSSSQSWKRWWETSHPRLHKPFICFCQRHFHGMLPLWGLRRKTMEKNICVATSWITSCLCCDKHKAAVQNMCHTGNVELHHNVEGRNIMVEQCWTSYINLFSESVQTQIYLV